MTGTPSQMEWAEQIKRRVNAEFDRVVNAFEEAAAKQSEQDRTDIEAIIAIVQRKRVEVMARNEAGYFIRDWQELEAQVRQMIGRDPAYAAIQAKREARPLRARSDQPAGEMSRIK
jgi:hypothetical protein